MNNFFKIIRIKQRTKNLFCFSGIYSVGQTPNTWIMLCTFFLALFLGFSKRRAELKNSNPNSFLRLVLRKYKIKFLDSLINDAAFGLIISYPLFCSISQNNLFH